MLFHFIIKFDYEYFKNNVLMINGISWLISHLIFIKQTIYSRVFIILEKQT